MIIKFSLKVWFKFGELCNHSELKNFILKINKRLEIKDSIIINKKIIVNKVDIRDPSEEIIFHIIK